DLLRASKRAAYSDGTSLHRPDAVAVAHDRRGPGARSGDARPPRGQADRLSGAGGAAGRRLGAATGLREGHAVRELGTDDKFEDDGRWRELVRTNDAGLVSAVGALLAAAYNPPILLDQNRSVLEGSIGILPRRILVNECCVDDARELLEDAGLGHELRPDVR